MNPPLPHFTQVCVSGERYFLTRYAPLTAALAASADRHETVFTPEIPEYLSRRDLLRRLFSPFPLLRYLRSPRGYDRVKSAWAFDYKSRQLHRHIAPLQPDFVFHLFAQSRPVPRGGRTPYVMSLDYTTALAEKNYPEWARFPSRHARDAWFAREQAAFEDATCLFPWSRHVAGSLEHDYGIPSSKIVVMGSSGNFTAFAGERVFGSHRLFMNASDFERKGGDLAVAALPLVRQQFPDASLVIAGTNRPCDVPGVSCAGSIAGAEAMKAQFLAADLVLAPARCEPYGSFLVEAMAYGTPCVVSNRGAMPEIVDHGVSGSVLDSLSPEALAAEICALFASPDRLRHYSAAARQKVSSQLNWPHIARLVLDAVSDRLHNKSPSL